MSHKGGALDVKYKKSVIDLCLNCIGKSSRNYCRPCRRKYASYRQKICRQNKAKNITTTKFTEYKRSASINIFCDTCAPKKVNKVSKLYNNCRRKYIKIVQSLRKRNGETKIKVKYLSKLENGKCNIELIKRKWLLAT